MLLEGAAEDTILGDQIARGGGGILQIIEAMSNVMTGEARHAARHDPKPASFAANKSA